MNEAILRAAIDRQLPLTLAILFIAAFFINQYFSNKALVISKRKRLFAEVNHRSSHADPIPSFGGVSIFVVLLSAILFVLGLGYSYSLSFVLLALFFLFLSGLKDDLVGTAPRTKLLVQIATALLIAFNSEFQFTHLGGFLGIEGVPYFVSLFLSVGFIVFVVNAYNLIDGIDGLAATTALIALSIFATLFYVNHNLPLLFISTALIGALLNFMFFNLGPEKKKMFMGDTGSLVIGYTLAILSLAVVAQQPIAPAIDFIPQNAPIFILSILIIPILDTLRIIIIRLSNGQKPWVADRNHMHHVLLDSGLTHRQATATLGMLQILAILGYLLVSGLGSIAQHFYLVCLYLTYTVLFMNLGASKAPKQKGFESFARVLRALLP